MYPNQTSLLTEKQSSLETSDNSTQKKATEPRKERDSNSSKPEGQKNSTNSNQSSPLKNLLNLK